jgi:hypothetical protein
MLLFVAGAVARLKEGAGEEAGVWEADHWRMAALAASIVVVYVCGCYFS